MSDFKKILEEECVKYATFRMGAMPTEFKNIIRQHENLKKKTRLNYLGYICLNEM